MLDKAIALLGEEHPIIHSDRGGHYRWTGWIDRMKAANLTRSMSKKGCSPDNSTYECFFGRLKNEMFYGRSWKDISIEAFMKTVDEYIHWCNEICIKDISWMDESTTIPAQHRFSLITRSRKRLQSGHQQVQKMSSPPNGYFS